MASRSAQNPADILSKSSMAAMNLKVLKRIDPEIVQVLGKAGHVALYDYDQATHKWASKGIEGTLFLVKRDSQPAHQFFVLNKKSQDHFVEDISKTFKYENTDADGRTYLLYRSSRGEVIGIWFYDKPECQEIVRLLQQVFENSAEPAEKQPQPHGDPAAFGSARNLTNLLMNVASKVAGTEENFWDSKERSSTSESKPLLANGTRLHQDVSSSMSEGKQHTTPVLRQPGLSVPAKAASWDPERFDNKLRQAHEGKPSQSPVRGSDALEKLFGSQRASASVPHDASPGGGASTSQSRGIPLFNTAEAVPSPSPQATLCTQAALAEQANLGTMSTPAAPPRRSQDAATSQPSAGLLRPSFFQQSHSAATPRDSMEGRSPLSASASQPPPSGHQDAFTKMFAPKSGPAAASADSTANGQASKAASAHAALRSAIVAAVTESEDFVPIVLQKLEKAGLLKQPPES